MRSMGDRTATAGEAFASSEGPGPPRAGPVVGLMRRIIAIVCAGIAVAASIPVLGGASDRVPLPTDAAVRVPAGMVEHTVTVQDVTGPHAARRRVRAELWLTRDRGRELVTDELTGEVVAETTAASGEIRVYEPELDRITVEHRRQLPFASAAYEAAAQRAALESGHTRKLREQIVGGRRALVTESPGGRTTTVVDAETYQLLERRTTLAGAVQTEHRTTELLPAGSPRAKLEMRPHPGAKVVQAS